ncbi:MAG: ATP-binding protein [Bacteroidaceae bacterium]|nr:ATP-binding protein [Bacteroidaceae bacterium]
MEKPFVFGVPADNVHFIGRESEIERLSANIKYGVNTVLMSPRRWGKTSLVNKVATSFSNEKERIIVRMDIFACRSEYDFYNVFSSELLKQTASKIDEWKKLAKGFIERLTPKISVNPDHTAEYSVSLGITPKTHTPQEILSLPQMIAERKKCDIIICIDEFQQIGEFPDSLNVQKKLRTAWQGQKSVSYCLYGSKMHMMMKLFQKKSYPFYRFGEILNLKPIPLETWIPYIKSRFDVFGKSISDSMIERICQTVEYQASYVQQLAYSILLLTDRDATETVFNAGVNDLISQNSGTFLEQTQSLTSYQLNFLRAVIDGISQGFGESSVREQYNLGSPSNIARLKQALIDKELIEQTETGIIIGDPVLRLWLSNLLK